MIESVTIPAGKSGIAEIKHVTVSREASQMNFIRSFGSGRYVPEGKYTQLILNGSLMMSDTPDEKRDHYAPVRYARGDCLVTGLGIGMVANAMAAKPDVHSVTVIEISADVISLVKDSLHPKVFVIEADAFEWKPPAGQMYEVVWHDIWRDICTDNLVELTRLKRKFARRAAGFQGGWCEELLRHRKRQEKRDRWW